MSIVTCKTFAVTIGRMLINEIKRKQKERRGRETERQRDRETGTEREREREREKETWMLPSSSTGPFRHGREQYHYQCVFFCFVLFSRLCDVTQTMTKNPPGGHKFQTNDHPSKAATFHLQADTYACPVVRGRFRIDAISFSCPFDHPDISGAIGTSSPIIPRVPFCHFDLISLSVMGELVSPIWITVRAQFRWNEGFHWDGGKNIKK